MGLYQVPGLFLTALCHAIVIYYMSEYRYRMKNFVFYSLIYSFCFVALGYGLYMAPAKAGILFGYMGIVVCTFLFFYFVSQDCFFKKSFLILTYFCLFSTIDNSLKIIIKLWFPFMTDLAGYYAAIVLRSAILLLILVLYNKYMKITFRFLSDFKNRRWWNLALLSFLFYLLQTTLSYVSLESSLPPLFLLLLFVALSVVMCVVYGVVFSNVRYMKKDTEFSLIRQNAEYFSRQLSLLQNADDIHKRLRHDMRHHLEVIARYAKAGDNARILEYVGEYSAEISESALRQYTVHQTLNSILSAYAEKAEESGVEFIVKCAVPAELLVRDIDLIALLGNLLENALHGCRESGKGNMCIHIRIWIQNSMFMTICDNTCSEDLKLYEGLPVKKSIGVSSILAVCRKYDGCLDYRVENGVCSARAVLNL